MTKGKVAYGAAECILSVEDGHYLLTCLEVPYQFRGYGHASRLIEICKFIAREDSMSLQLWAGLGCEKFDQQALFEFYQRHGFYFFDPERPNWMEYNPCTQ